MDPTDQTVQLKPSTYSHISLCSLPIIKATIPNTSLSSYNQNIVATNGQSVYGSQQVNNLNTLQNETSLNKVTQVIPLASAGVCLTNLQLQQLQMQQQVFSQNLSHNHFNRQNDDCQQKQGNQLLQIHLTAPFISTSAINSTANDSETQPSNTNGNPLMVNKTSAMTQDSNEILSNESTSSGSSELNLKQNQPILMTTTQHKSSNQKNDYNNYVDLSRASCSNGSSATSIKLSSSESSFATIKSNSSNNKGFNCQICNRDFTQKGNLKTHLMTHSGERPYECHTCGKNFTQKGNLDTHVKIHTETKDHKCQYCDRGFTQRGNLKTHIRSIHTKEKPYACGHCGKSFSQKGNMLTHYRTHDKDARFPCHVCGKTFSQKGNLKTHQQRHGRNSAV